MVFLKERNKAIGLLDSGVGGLTVVREIFKLMPAEDLIYYGDTLHLPYGPKDLNLVQSYVEKIIEYLLTVKNVKAVIIACNTATSAALDYVRDKFEIPIFGVIKSAAAEAAVLTRNNKIAVIGTEGTIKSRAYQKAVKNYKKEAAVFAEACPEFVKLVEEGKFRGAEVSAAANYYLSPLLKVGIDTLILGCTHFPYLSPALAETVGKKVKLINPAYQMAVEVKNYLKKKKILKTQDSAAAEHQFIVSDQARISQRFLEHGRRFLDLKELNFEEENIFNKQLKLEVINYAHRW